jgi:hypothetical protein
VDAPKSLASAEERRVRLALLDAPHVAPLTRFVVDLRAQMGPQYSIPNFDPLDGGINADCLFLLEAPGPNAITSGFISRNNPDETAKNFFLLNQEASIVRTRTVSWNVVPWYVGSGTRIRAANPSDIRLALPALTKLLQLLTRLRIVALIGRKAATAREAVTSLCPVARIFTLPHPSPMFVNRSPHNRERILVALREVAAALNSGVSDG